MHRLLPSAVAALAGLALAAPVAGAQTPPPPQPAVHHVGGLLRGSPDVRLETAPGGHLGVLTGRTAASTTWKLLDEWLDAPPAAGKRRRRRRTAA